MQRRCTHVHVEVHRWKSMVSSPMIHFVHGSSSPPSVRNQFSSLRLELSSIENFDHVSLLKFPIKFEVGNNK